MEDGSPYPMQVKSSGLVAPSTFARTSSLLEVQGTWSFSKDLEEMVTLQLYVGQTLCYDTARARTLSGFKLKTCVNSPDGSGAEFVQVPLELPEESLKVNDQGAKFPYEH